MKLSTTINQTIEAMPADATLYAFVPYLPRKVDRRTVIVRSTPVDALAVTTDLLNRVEAMRIRGEHVVIVADARLLAVEEYAAVRAALDKLLLVADGLVFLVETYPSPRPAIRLPGITGLLLESLMLLAGLIYRPDLYNSLTFALHLLLVVQLVASFVAGWRTVRPGWIAWAHMNTVTRRQIDAVAELAVGGHGTRIQAADVLLVTA